MSNFKLIAIDIDGTLLNSKGELTEKTLNSIKKCHENGIKVCLCTGRNIKNTIKLAKKLNNDMPFVCGDGTIFYDTKNDNIISEYKLSEDTFTTIMTEAINHNVYLEFCTKKYYIKYVKDKKLSKFSYGMVSKTLRQKFREYFIISVRYVKNYNKFIKDFKNNINQMIIAGEQNDLEVIKKFMDSNNFLDVDIRTDLWDKYIFVVPKNCTKAYGLDILSKHFNIPIENMIAIGDQMNDIDMIKRAGLGIAMGNAHDEIKKNAKFITKKNDEDGVSYAIEKFIFSNEL